jgi:hypothetical protein
MASPGDVAGAINVLKRRKMMNQKRNTSDARAQLIGWMSRLLLTNEDAIPVEDLLGQLETAGELNIPSDDPDFVQNLCERSGYIDYLISEVVGDLESLLSIDLGKEGYAPSGVVSSL